MPCPHCNAEVAPSDVYCISCGARLTPSAPAPVGDPTPPQTVLQHGSAATSGPPTASASLHPLPRRRWPLILLTLLVNLLLLVGSAWLVYAALVRYAERSQPSMSLGAPRLVRVAPRPAPAPDAAPAVAAKVPETKATKTAQAPATPPKTPAPPAKSKGGKVAKAGTGTPTATPTVTPTPTPTPAEKKTPASRPVASEPKTSSEPTADEVRAGLDAESVRMVVQHHLPQVRACYDRALKQQDGLAGSVEVEFEVSSDGRVRSSKVHSNTTGHDGLGKCIAGLLKTWRFPKPVGGDVVFIYPFLFSSGE